MLDQFFFKRYNKDRYNCGHFVAEVWKVVTGQSIDTAMGSFLRPASERDAPASIRAHFSRILAPDAPCIVLMTRPHSEPHVGIYLDGKVLHIHEYGTEFQPLDVASRGFRKVKFYKCLSS